MKGSGQSVHRYLDTSIEPLIQVTLFKETLLAESFPAFEAECADNKRTRFRLKSARTVESIRRCLLALEWISDVTAGRGYLPVVLPHNYKVSSPPCACVKALAPDLS